MVKLSNHFILFIIHYRSASDDNLEHLAEISNGISYFDSDGKIIQYWRSSCMRINILLSLCHDIVLEEKDKSLNHWCKKDKKDFFVNMYLSNILFLLDLREQYVCYASMQMIRFAIYHLKDGIRILREVLDSLRFKELCRIYTKLIAM